MLVLALDTATSATSVAVVELIDGSGATVREQRQVVDARAHGEQLAPQLAAALAAAAICPDQLAAIVAGTGPGPFTGLRVGLATAAALGHALDLPTYGVCSLDGIAAAVEPDRPALVATDARRHEVYWALYAGHQRITGPAVDRPADLLPILVEHGVDRGYGEGVLRYRAVLGLPVPAHPGYPDPAALARLAAGRVTTGAPSERLAPRYLRRPDVAAPRPPKPATVR